nr:FAD-dependent oxidoreductase [Rhodococcus rhodnii]
MTTMRTVIIGGVAAGMSAATRLRRADETMDIVVLERGEHVSFANCGLPYHLGGAIADREDLLLQTPQSLYDRFRLDVRVRHTVERIDRAEQVVHVRDSAGETYTLGYDALVVATGAHPVTPPLPGIERAHRLRDIADLDRIVAALDSGDTPPRTAAVLGGGFIGLELAENLTRRGVAVTVVELADQVLAPLDPEMAAPVRDRLEANGVTVRLGAGAREIGSDTVVLDTSESIDADLVVSAVGVRPESTLAREAGLEIGERGGIVVDEQLRTSDPAIHAVGDVAEKRDAVSGEQTLVPLVQTANRHGRLVADVVTGRHTSTAPVLGTAIVGVFGLAAATVGWSAKRLRAAGRPYRAIHTHPADHATYYPGAATLSLELLVDPATDTILGAQAVGEAGVDKRIDVIATAMRGGLHASELADLELAYAPQFGSAKDPVNMLGMIADNLAQGVTETVQWHEVEDEILAGTAVVDVRTPEEFASGSLPKAVNVPLDELRERLDEVPGGRVVVTCAVGQRGHSAARILRQNGRDAVNLDGGVRTWAAATGR